MSKGIRKRDVQKEKQEMDSEIGKMLAAIKSYIEKVHPPAHTKLALELRKSLWEARHSLLPKASSAENLDNLGNSLKLMRLQMEDAGMIASGRSFISKTPLRPDEPTTGSSP